MSLCLLLWRHSNSDIKVLHLAPAATSILYLQRRDVSVPLPGKGYPACGLAPFVWILSMWAQCFRCCCLVAVPVVAPSNISGGGGTSRELTITWTVGWTFHRAGRAGRGGSAGSCQSSQENALAFEELGSLEELSKSISSRQRELDVIIPRARLLSAHKRVL